MYVHGLLILLNFSVIIQNIIYTKKIKFLLFVNSDREARNTYWFYNNYVFFFIYICTYPKIIQYRSAPNISWVYLLKFYLVIKKSKTRKKKLPQYQQNYIGIASYIRVHDIRFFAQKFLISINMTNRNRRILILYLYNIVQT